MKKFKEGCVYYAKCGDEIKEQVKIIKRTAKFATVEYWGRSKRVAIKEKANQKGEVCESLFILWEGVFASDIA